MVLDLPEQTFMTQPTYYDAETNEKLFSEDLGQWRGLVGFKKIPQDILDLNKRIKIEALIDIKWSEQLSPSIYSKVISASLAPVTLNKFCECRGLRRSRRIFSNQLPIMNLISNQSIRILGIVFAQISQIKDRNRETCLLHSIDRLERRTNRYSHHLNNIANVWF